MTVEVVPVSTKRHLKDFLKVPFNLHQQDPNWVPPLNLAMKQTFDKKNPFFKRARLQSWVAYKNNQPIGRISGIINDVHNEFHKEKTAFWGFYESDNCIETAKILFKTVEQWAAQQNMMAIRGPMNPSTNHECGLQISAFETRPFLMMTQNPPYYQQLVETLGHQKIKDLQAWIIDTRTAKINSRLVEKIKRIQERNQIVIRTLNMKKFDEEVETIFKIYNDAWEKNWGFLPLSEEEYRHAAKDLKSIVLPKLVYILEVKGVPAAFSVWLPDFNQVMIHIRDGNLFPTGLFKLLWHTKIKKTITQGRVPLLGIKQEFQHMPLGAMLYFKYFEEVKALGYPIGECSWILENNLAMQNGLRFINAEHYKTYRIYEKNL